VLRGDLLFNGSSETPDEVAFCSLLAEEVPIYISTASASDSVFF
jgi:hypothetical protein